MNRYLVFCVRFVSALSGYHSFEATVLGIDLPTGAIYNQTNKPDDWFMPILEGFQAKGMDMVDKDGYMRYNVTITLQETL